MAEQPTERLTRRPNRFPELTLDIVRGLFTYDPLTGDLSWKINRGRKAKAGDLAGTVDQHGYVTVMVSGRKVQAHRLIWFISHGHWPDEQLHPRDKNKENLALDNWIEHRNWVDPKLAKHRESQGRWREKKLRQFERAFPDLVQAARAQMDADQAHREARAVRKRERLEAAIRPAGAAPRQRTSRS